MYVAGPAYDPSQKQGADFSQFKFTESADGKIEMTGLIDNPIWLGYHMFEIESRNGVYDEFSNRGSNGLFGSAYSDVLEIDILNPCKNAIVNGNNGLVLQEISDAGSADTFRSIVYTGPAKKINEGSCANDCDLCGALSYKLLTN